MRPEQSQDLLNVLLQPGGQSVYKRDGYALFQTLPISTEPIHGAYHFQQTGGSDVQLWGQGVNLDGIVGDGAAVVVATGTEAATWQCTDNLGFAYCLNSSNDMAVKTSGSAASASSYVAAIPQGTMVTSTPLQLVVAGVSGNISTLYFSANNNFSNFTTGPLSTDPFTEIINAPGSRITHIGYYFGKLFWWKDQSFGYLTNFNSQYTVTVTIVSNQIGTLDNSSAFWNPTVYETANQFSSGAGPQSSGNPYFNEAGTLGGIFFRGQDNHIYQYDGYTLTRLTRIISPTVTQASRRKLDSWTQSSQSDFNGGGVLPSLQISTAVSPGDVIVSSFTVTENSGSSGWSSGSTNNMTVGTSSISLSYADGNIANNSFENGSITNWTIGGSDASQGTGWTSGASYNCTVTPRTGSKIVYWAGVGLSNDGMTSTLKSCDGLTTYNSTVVPWVSNSCSWVARTLSSSGAVGKKVKIVFARASTGSPVVTSDCFTNSGSNITFYTASDFHLFPISQPDFALDDVIGGSDTVTSGSFTSQIFNTGLTSATYQLSNFAWTVDDSTPTFSLLTSTANPTNNWVTTLTSSGTNAVGNKYARYVASITFDGSMDARTSITAVTVLARSSGTYYSAVNNAPTITNWGTLGVNDFTNGGSTITYYVRASSNSFTVLSSTPAWTAQQKNSQVNLTFPALSIATTFFQMRADFGITAATETPTINDFTFNWFEGSAADKMYVQYFQDALWFSVSGGTTTSTNNEILYLDLLNNAWLKHDIAANGFLVENNALYFGSPTTGRVYKYGGVTTDAGANIRSYWKSKDFTGDDPTVQNEFLQADFTFSAVQSTVTYTYTTDQKTATVLSIPTYDSASSIVKRGFLLAPGKIGTYFNFQIGDNSAYPAWKMMLHRVHFNKLNWKPQNW